MMQTCIMADDFESKKLYVENFICRPTSAAYLQGAAFVYKRFSLAIISFVKCLNN